jgi:ABC-type branched-subunit amino acid transport system substrate-binding protein
MDVKSNSIRRVAVVAVAALMVGTASVGLSVPAGAKEPTGAPIKFGYLGTLTGPSAEPQIEDAFRAYIADWNKRGGYKNQPIDVLFEQVGFDPAKNIASVNKLVGEGVVAFVAGGFCQITLPALRQAAIPTFGASAKTCEDPFMIATASQATTLPMLTFAIDNGGAKVFGVTYPAGVPGLRDGFVGPLEDYAALHPGVKIVDAGTPGLQPTGADIDLAIAKMKDAGVTALFYAAQADTSLLYLESARRNGFGPEDGIKWIGGPNLYDPKVIAANPDVFEGTYALSQNYPWEETNNPAVKEMIKVTKNATDIHDGFAASGYSLGSLLEHSLKGLKGKITRESLLKHWKSLTKFKLEMAPLTLNFADVNKNPSGGQIMQSKGGKFVPAGDYQVTKAKEFAPQD